MGYLHVEVEIRQASKVEGTICGDIVLCRRTVHDTTIAVADGIGSGINAHVAAQMALSRFFELLEGGFSFRRAFTSLVKTIGDAKANDLPYAAISVAHILPEGKATVLGFEVPPPIFIGHRRAMTLPAHPILLENHLAQETHLHLDKGEGLLLVSDGITQAGLGKGAGLADGWKIEGLERYLNHELSEGLEISHIPEKVQHQAQHLEQVGNEQKHGDDRTVVLARCRPGKVVNIFTGPPLKPTDDRPLVHRFMLFEGIKIVAGATTAKIVADALHKPVGLKQNTTSLIAPPAYAIDGIDLVTEGAVTLNQVYNLLDEPDENFVEDSDILEFCRLLKEADRVNILEGRAFNQATSDIAFRQQGILPRAKIVTLIAQKLREQGKLVVQETL